MERLNLKTLRSIAKRLELRGYSKLRKSQLIDFIVTGLDSRRSPPPPPPRKRPPKPTRAPPPPPARPPPPPLQTFKPYQLKAKRDVIEPPIEEQSIDPKKLKQMKRKLDELNRKIRHSRKKHDGMIHKRNALRKAIADIKVATSSSALSTSTRPTIEPEWNFTERERAFRGAYRSYRVNGRPRIDYSTFFSRIRGGLIDLIK